MNIYDGAHAYEKILVNGRCGNCGAAINFSENDGKCPYCGTEFLIRDITYNFNGSNAAVTKEASQALMEQAKICLEAHEFDRALSFAEQYLSINANDGDAHILALLAKNRATSMKYLFSLNQDTGENVLPEKTSLYAKESYLRYWKGRLGSFEKDSYYKAVLHFSKRNAKRFEERRLELLETAESMLKSVETEIEEEKIRKERDAEEKRKKSLREAAEKKLHTRIALIIAALIPVSIISALGIWPYVLGGGLCILTLCIIVKLGL